MSLQDPAQTDWQALGLPDASPFEILSRPRAPLAQPKPKPKKVRKSRLEQTLASLEDLPRPIRFNTDIMSRAESDRTNAIAGRGLT